MDDTGGRTGAGVPPSVIAANIDYSNEYISRRCQQLAEEGFIQRTDPSNYQITDRGKKFLTGELVDEKGDD
jgi:predicted transcriptional regulator